MEDVNPHPIITRDCKGADYYVANVSTDMWANVDVDVTNTSEESFEDKIIVTINDEKYEILPYSRTRMKVVRHYEALEVIESKASPAYGVSAEVATKPDREILSKDVAINAVKDAERYTSDPLLWKALEKLNRPQREVTIRLPQGVSLSRWEQRRLQKMVGKLTKGELEGALKLFGKLGTKASEKKPAVA